MALRRSSGPRTAEAIALTELRDAIIRGDLPPGAPIRQGQAAEQLGLSVIPVREALKTLAGEGIVTYQAQRGYTVTELRPESVDEIFGLRSVLESQAEAAALARLQPEDLAAMREALNAQRRATDLADPHAVILANRAFHFALLDRCDNEWLMRFVRQLWEALEPHRALSYRRAAGRGDRTRADAILGEHEAILVRLEAGDTDAVLQALAHHREAGQGDFHRLLSSPEGEQPAADRRER